MAHAQGIPVLVDGAQSVPHMPINVQAMDCDFFVFSGHKLFGPTGIGVLYGKSALLEEMPPYQGGGSMIKDVTFEKTTYQGPPQKFEAGTPDIAGVVGLGAAIDYLSGIGMPAIFAYEHELLEYATQAMAICSRATSNRNGFRQGQCTVVRHGRLQKRTGRPAFGSLWHRRAGRTPLCPTDSAPVRIGRNGPSVARVLQYT